MFRLQRLKNWAHSSIASDKQELNAYQSFLDQFSLIDSKIEEYLSELGMDDRRLFVDYNGKEIPINFLKIMSESTLKDKNLSSVERACQSAELIRIYYEKLKQLKNKIISIAVNETDNIYLIYINSCINIINSLLKEYAHLLAVQRSGIYSINNIGNHNAGEKIKNLKDNIEIRTAEINSRLTMENLRKK